MLGSALETVFANAALPQKAVLIALVAAMPMTLIASILAMRRGMGRRLWRRIIAYLGLAGPALGLFAGGLNSFHMAETIRRLPFDPTLKQLAPGIFEVSTLVSLGALVGLVALSTNVMIDTLSVEKQAL